MPDVKYDTNYYVKLPNHEVYLKEASPVSIVFSEFFSAATPYRQDEAIRIAKKYSLVVEECTITTTTEVAKKIIYQEKDSEEIFKR